MRDIFNQIRLFRAEPPPHIPGDRMFRPGASGKEQVIKLHCPGTLSPTVGTVTLDVASGRHRGDKAGKSLLCDMLGKVHDP